MRFIAAFIVLELVGVWLSVRGSFADIAATIADLLLNERDSGSFARDVVRP